MCSPTRSSLMTGKHNARLGITTWHEAAAEGPTKGRQLTPPDGACSAPVSSATGLDALPLVFQPATAMGSKLPYQ